MKHKQSKETTEKDTTVPQITKRSNKWISDNTQWTDIRGLLEKYPTFGREKETGLLGALDT